MWLRTPQCRGAFHGTAVSGQHSPHSYFPTRMGRSLTCPGWTPLEAAGTEIAAAALLRYAHATTGDGPWMLTLGPGARAALTVVAVPHPDEVGDGPLTALFGTPIMTRAEAGWRLTTGDTLIAEGGGT